MSQYRLAAGVLRADMDGDQVLLNPKTGVYHLLNETGGEVLETLSAGASVGECVRGLSSRSGFDEAIVRVDVQAFVDGLLERGLIVPAGEES